MSFKLYKEGEGTWSRGTLACILGGTGFVAAISTYRALSNADWAQTALFRLPFFAWDVKPDVLLSALVLVPFGFAGVWLYNHARLSDFLIDTETELRTKVVWPSRKEAMNNSIVVVATCLLMAVWVFFADVVLRILKNQIYSIGS